MPPRDAWTPDGEIEIINQQARRMGTRRPRHEMDPPCLAGTYSCYPLLWFWTIAQKVSDPQSHYRLIFLINHLDFAADQPAIGLRLGKWRVISTGSR
jgi:hypothetical protein